MDVVKLSCPACGAPIPKGLSLNQQFNCPACSSVLVLMDLLTADQVLCPACQTVNHETSQACTHCGASLKIECAYCTATNHVGVMHCHHCGANLQNAQERKLNWLAEKRRHDAERLEAWKRAQVDDRQARLQRLLEALDEPINHPLAVYCLAQLGAEAVEPLIETLKTDRDVDARFGAAHALGQIGDDRAVPVLITALDDPEPVVRYWAVDALGKFKTEPAQQAIRKLLGDHHPGVRANVARVLLRVGPDQTPQRLSQDRVIALTFLAVVVALVVLTGVFVVVSTSK